MSFVGILLTIAISYSSLIQQRNAAARESIEQLDDIRLHRTRGKFKPILHSFSYWPNQKAVVKLKWYMPTKAAGVSRVHHQFLAFPGYVFQDYSVEPVSDGYLLEINSADPVEIRRITDELLGKMAWEGRNVTFTQTTPFDYFKRNYQNTMKGELVPIQRAILDYLDETRSRSDSEIEEHLKNHTDHQPRFMNIALRDLEEWDYIQKDPDVTGRYLLVNSG